MFEFVRFLKQGYAIGRQQTCYAVDYRLFFWGMMEGGLRVGSSRAQSESRWSSKIARISHVQSAVLSGGK